METRYRCYVTTYRVVNGQKIGKSGWLRIGGGLVDDQNDATHLTWEQMGALLKLVDLPYDQHLHSFTAYPVR